MTLDPRMLEMIANPTGGKLGEMGKTYSAVKQQKLINETAEKEAKWKEMDRGTKAVMAFSSEAKTWKEKNPTATDEEFKAFQDAQYQRTPDVLKKYAKEEFQTIDQYDQGYEHALGIQKAFHPEQYAETDKDKSVGARTGFILNEKGERVGTGFSSTLTGDVEMHSGGKMPAGYQFVAKEATQASLEAGKSGKDPYKILREDVLQKSVDAEANMPTLNMINDVISDPKWEQGAFSELLAGVSNVAKSLNLPAPTNPAEAYVVMGAAADNVIAKMGGIRGNLNKEEVKIAVSAAAAITNPREAAQVKIKLAREVAIRNQERHIEMDKFGTNMSGFKQRWDKINKGKEVLKRVVNDKGKATMFFYSEQKEKAIAFIEAQVAREQLEGDDAIKAFREGLAVFNKKWGEL